MQQVFPIEKHREQSNNERACNINQKRGQRKPPVVMFVNAEGRQITGQRANAAAGKDEKASNKQSTDFSA